jgi:hypothetical protein
MKPPRPGLASIEQAPLALEVQRFDILGSMQPGIAAFPAQGEELDHDQVPPVDLGLDPEAGALARTGFISATICSTLARLVAGGTAELSPMQVCGR